MNSIMDFSPSPAHFYAFLQKNFICVDKYWPNPDSNYLDQSYCSREQRHFNDKTAWQSEAKYQIDVGKSPQESKLIVLEILRKKKGENNKDQNHSRVGGALLLNNF